MSTPWRLTTHPAELSITLHDPAGAEVPLDPTDGIHRLGAFVERGPTLSFRCASDAATGL